MGVQISRRVHPEVPPQGAIRATAGSSRRIVPQVSNTKGKPDRRRAFDAGSCAHDDFDPTKYAASQVIGYVKGKSAIHLARVYGERRRNFVGQHFWARGYFVSTMGRDEAAMREYIKSQEKEDQRLEQLNLWR